MPKLASLLSVEEKKRADRFHFETDRSRYIIGRGLLRILLGQYLGQDPSSLLFDYGRFGKPFLPYPVEGRNLEFNLSHSGNVAVYAFNWDQPIGVDVEHIHPMKDMDDFARQFFTPAECRLIESLGPDEKQRTFFKLWTCKEAYLKAHGSGLNTPLNEVEIYFPDEERAQIVSIGGDQRQAALWRLEVFTPFENHPAALATQGSEKKPALHEI